MSYDVLKNKLSRSGREFNCSHACAVPGCGKRIALALLMCAPHWRMVPQPLQRAVYSKWRNGGSKAYLAARDAAIKSVNGGQS